MGGRAGRWGLILLAAAVVGPLPTDDAAAAGPSVGAGRRVLGSIRTAGRVEGTVDGRQWLPLHPDAAILDGMLLRVPGEGSATLTLTSGDQVVFESWSAGAVSNADAPVVRLDRGRVVLTLRPASALTVEGGRGIVRTVAGKPAAAAAVVRREGTQTYLETRAGILELRAAGTEEGTLVAAGYQAWVGDRGPATEATATATAPEDERDRRAGAGVLGIAGLSTTAALAVAGGIVATGVGVGAAAASGSFEDDGSSSPSTASTGGGGREGSPFRPIQK